MFKRFTDRALKVMSLARKNAQRFHHDFIGTEHILLALIGEDGGVALQVLANLELETSAIQSQLEKRIQAVPASSTTASKLPFTPRANKALEFAKDEADGLRHDRIDTEHLLLGLVREGEGVAARVLLDLGLNLEEAREEVVHLVGGETWWRKKATGVPSTEAELLARAGEESLSAGHGFVGTGHLLLALLSDGEGSARRILEDLGVDAGRIRGEKLKLARYDLEALPEKKLLYSPLLTDVLERSLRLALFLGQESFDSRHLLLALVADEHSYEARVLVQLGLDIGEARRLACAVLNLDPEKARRVLLGKETGEANEGVIKKLLRKLTL